jgi:hypothetical protein
MTQLKRWIVPAAVLLVLAAPMTAGVVKKSKSQVTFKGFGTLSLEQSELVSTEKKASSTKTDFKGKGILGKTLGSAMLRSGSFGEIIDLPAMTVTSLDDKKKEYSIRPIEKITLGQPSGQAESGQQAEAKPVNESDIKIIRSEFKVEDTGETQTFNQFPCKKYAINWEAEWENVKTGAKGTDKMTTLVWTTPMSGELQAAQAEELKFSQGYLKAVGLDANVLERDVLGGQWVQLLSSVNPANPAPSPKGQKVANELKKIEGYPIVIDGKYFAIRPEGEKKAEEEGGGGLSLGKLAMGALKKKPKPGEDQEPAIGYYIEIQALVPAQLDDSVFRIPAGYKLK